MPTIGDLTVAFWMRTTKNTSAQGLFSIPNSIKFWGNFDIFLENNNSETQAFSRFISSIRQQKRMMKDGLRQK